MELEVEIRTSNWGLCWNVLHWFFGSDIENKFKSKKSESWCIKIHSSWGKDRYFLEDWLRDAAKTVRLWIFRLCWKGFVETFLGWIHPQPRFSGDPYFKFPGLLSRSTHGLSSSKTHARPGVSHFKLEEFSQNSRTRTNPSSVTCPAYKVNIKLVWHLSEFLFWSLVCIGWTTFWDVAW